MTIFNLLLIGIICLLTVVGFVSIYAVFTCYSPIEINKCILDGFLYRFNQGSVPAHNDLGVIGKGCYALKLIFWDSAAFDHSDKYASGIPGIPLIFTAMFIIGITRLKESTLVIWLISAAVLFAFYLSSGRYSLLILPCMAIVAASGVIQLTKPKRLR